MYKQILPLVLAGALLQAGASSDAMAEAKSNTNAAVFVQVRNTNLRSQPKQWAAAVGQLNFGDKVEIVDHQGDWFKVKARGSKQGFVHASAFAADDPDLATNSGSAGNEGGSQAVLAGKGFDPSIERQFASSDVAVNFAAVDRMEKVNVSSGQIAGFIRQGKLAGEG